jgi:hypothetical protein
VNDEKFDFIPSITVLNKKEAKNDPVELKKIALSL